MRRRTLGALALAAGVAVAACTFGELNPQPLPPGNENGATYLDAGAKQDGGGFSTGPETPPRSDASPIENDHDAGNPGTVPGQDGGTPPDGGYGGDGGADGGGDAAPDADGG